MHRRGIPEVNFDYVIIGGGSAGSVLAERLSKDGRYTVLVLEAGPPDTNRFIQVPAGFIKTLFDPKVTWQFKSEPSAGTAGRQIQITQGKTLGGSSAVNGGVYNRGQRNDYDSWAQRGNPGWSYDEILPYFRRTEHRLGAGDDHYRGREGSLPITTPVWPSVLCDAFFESAGKCGLPFNPDYNGATQEGVGRYQAAILNGRRHSAAKAFLHPAAKRSNVSVLTSALVRKIVLQNRRATGVEFVDGDGTKQSVSARRGVILSAGVLNSPKILQLSGIGPPPLLQSLGLAVQHALPGVGENLCDHYSPRLVFRVKGADTLNSHVKGVALGWQIIQWLRGKPSVLSLAPALCHGFGKTEPALDRPDYSLVFTPASYKLGRIGVLDDFPGMTCGVWQMRPESRGYVRIQSPDANAPALVNPMYLSADVDRRTLVAALKRAREIFQVDPIASFIDSESLPGNQVSTDDEWLDFARHFGSSSYHLVGSCKMGPAGDPTAVVDSRLRVHGLEALHVVDSSIMPAVPSANSYAATLMIAEKAADLILE
jgi:choline dehydrogenase